jgi:CheY-like chemotaxis protein
MADSRERDGFHSGAVTARIMALARSTQAEILVVDDDELELALVCDRLQSCALDVRQAVNGAQALEWLGREWFPVVLTDWQMPVMSGIEMTEQLRARGLEDTYVIMLTVLDSGFDYERAYTPSDARRHEGDPGEHGQAPGSGNLDVDQKRPATPVAGGQKVGELLERAGARRFDAQAVGQRHPIHRRFFQIEQVERGLTGVGADIAQLHFQNRILAIAENEGGDIQSLARLGPEGLDVVERGPVAFEVDYAAAGRSNSRACCKGHPFTDRTATELQPIVWRGSVRAGIERKAEADTLVDDDRLVR